MLEIKALTIAIELVLLAVCAVLGYVLDVHSKESGNDMMRNNNASRRRRRSRRKKKRSSSRSRRRRRGRSRSRRRRRRRGRRGAKRSRSKQPKKSKSVEKPTQSPMVTINLVPQIIEPTTINEEQPDQKPTIVGRRRVKPQQIEKKKSSDRCVNYEELYPSLFQAAEHADSIRNVLPCNENDTAKLSKYEYELNYDEEHLFRC